MPRNNESNASGGGGFTADRVQPGRVMFVLRDALVDDELVYQIATQCGEVKNVHRPPSNRQLVFVQYEDPSCAEVAIQSLKRLPIFRAVDPAIKSERFNNDKSGGGNDDQPQQRNMVPASFSSGGKSSRQQKAFPPGTLLRRESRSLDVRNDLGAVKFHAVQQQTLQLNQNAAPLINDNVVSAMNFYLKPPSMNPGLVRLLDTVGPQPQRRPFSPFSQHPMKNQHNKGGAKQQKGGNNANYNNLNGHGGGNDLRNGRNDDFNDVSYSSMDSGSPQTLTGQTDPYQPKFSLGCWSCTKMPSFECRCGAFYCDAECQRADWPTHKDICMPRLVPISYCNKRILQEATAAKQNLYSPMQQTQNNQRGQTNAKNNSFNNKNKNQAANQPTNQQKNQQQQQQQPKPKPAQVTPKSSPASDSADDKVGRVTNKLQRLKIAKSVVGANAAVPTPVSKGVLLPGVFPREGSTVKITASLPSGVAYIYHNNGKESGQHSDYYLLTNRMYKAANDAKPLTQVPAVDDIIFAPFLGGYYRAKVISVDGEKLEVFFVDFGNSDTVLWKESREIADGDLKWAKYLTFPVVLEGVDTFSEEMIKLLETLEHVQEFDLVKAEPGKGSIAVVLKRPKQSLTLNMELMELKERELRLKKEREAQKERERLEKEREKKLEQEKEKQKKIRKPEEVKVADPSNYQPVLFDELMETKQLLPGGPKKLLIIDASEMLETRIISVIAFEEVEKYAAIVDHCNRAGKADGNVYKPTEEGEVCLVLHQGDWSRALFDISDGSFMLLDVGIIASIPAADVRRFAPGLSHVVYNNEVFVDNLRKLKGMMTDDKPDSVHGLPIDARIAASEDGISITIVDAAGADAS